MPAPTEAELSLALDDSADVYELYGLLTKFSRTGYSRHRAFSIEDYQRVLAARPGLAFQERNGLYYNRLQLTHVIAANPQLSFGYLDDDWDRRAYFHANVSFSIELFAGSLGRDGIDSFTTMLAIEVRNYMGATWDNEAKFGALRRLFSELGHPYDRFFDEPSSEKSDAASDILHRAVHQTHASYVERGDSIDGDTLWQILLYLKNALIDEDASGLLAAARITQLARLYGEATGITVPTLASTQLAL